MDALKQKQLNNGSKVGSSKKQGLMKNEDTMPRTFTTTSVRLATRAESEANKRIVGELVFLPKRTAKMLPNPISFEGVLGVITKTLPDLMMMEMWLTHRGSGVTIKLREGHSLLPKSDSMWALVPIDARAVRAVITKALPNLKLVGVRLSHRATGVTIKLAKKAGEPRPAPRVGRRPA